MTPQTARRLARAQPVRRVLVDGDVWWLRDCPLCVHTVTTIGGDGTEDMVAGHLVDWHRQIEAGS